MVPNEGALVYKVILPPRKSATAVKSIRAPQTGRRPLAGLAGAWKRTAIPSGSPRRFSYSLWFTKKKQDATLQVHNFGRA